MKKLLSIFLLTILFVPIMVNADVAAPDSTQYKAVVINPDGIDYYDLKNRYAGSLYYEEEFMIMSEFNNAYYIKVDGEQEEYKIKSLAGVMKVKDSVNPSDLKEFIDKEDGKIIINVSPGMYMLKGPSDTYSKIENGFIEKGKEVNYSYIIEDSGYVYAEYNGVKGWINILDERVLFKDDTNYIFKEDYDMECAVVPSNTILKAKYTTDYWDGETLFEYNGCGKLIDVFDTDEILDMDEDEAIASEKLVIYEYYNEEGNLLGTIPKGKTFKVYAYGISDEDEDYDDAYVEYNGIKGWVYAHEDAYDFVTSDEEEEEETEKTTKEEKNTNDIILYVSTGLAIGFATSIIIILINRNKKLKGRLKNKE